MIIGQFTVIVKGHPQTVALDSDFRWTGSERLLLALVKALFPATDEDRGPAAGNPGEGLIRRAAERFGGSVLIFTTPTFAPPGAVF